MQKKTCSYPKIVFLRIYVNDKHQLLELITVKTPFV